MAAWPRAAAAPLALLALLRGLLAAELDNETLETLRRLGNQSEPRCDLPRIDGRGLTWSKFKERGLRGSGGVIISNLFTQEDLKQWRRGPTLYKHGNETLQADDTRGRYAFVRLRNYVMAQNPDKMIFLSNSLIGVFGEAMKFALGPPRKDLLQDFEERPILSIGVEGSSVPKHSSHAETWHALLGGQKAWWLSKSKAASDFPGWEDPCGQLRPDQPPAPAGVQLCIQRPGEILYFGEGVDHSVCSTRKWSLGVGAQGHTEEWPKLLRAANRGDLAAVNNMMRKEKKEYDRQVKMTAGAYQHTPVHRAALHGHFAVVRRLITNGGDVDARDADGLTPIFLAAFSGHSHIVKDLANRGEGIEAKDPRGAGILQWASTHGHFEVVQAIVGRDKVDKKQKDDTGGGAMSAAATMGHVKIVEHLKRYGAEVEEKDHEGMRPMHWAAIHGHQEMTHALIKARAHPHKADKQGRKPLDLALDRGHHPVAEALRNAKAPKSSKKKRKPVVEPEPTHEEL